MREQLNVFMKNLTSMLDQTKCRQHRNGAIMWSWGYWCAHVLINMHNTLCRSTPASPSEFYHDAIALAWKGIDDPSHQCFRCLKLVVRTQRYSPQNLHETCIVHTTHDTLTLRRDLEINRRHCRCRAQVISTSTVTSNQSVLVLARVNDCY